MQSLMSSEINLNDEGKMLDEGDPAKYGCFFGSMLYTAVGRRSVILVNSSLLRLYM